MDLIIKEFNKGWHAIKPTNQPTKQQIKQTKYVFGGRFTNMEAQMHTFLML